jgi:hypothetical protein
MSLHIAQENLFSDFFLLIVYFNNFKKLYYIEKISHKIF